MRLLARETAAALIDIQEKLLPHMEDHEQLLARLLLLARGLRILNIPLMVTEQYPRGLGPTVPELKAALGDQEILEKISFSCCDAPEFMARLREGKRKNIVLAGIEAHVCVLQTVFDLSAAGFTPVVVADCVSSRRAAGVASRRIACERIRAEGGIVTTAESLLFELCRRADNPAFREISHLVK